MNGHQMELQLGLEVQAELELDLWLLEAPKPAPLPIRPRVCWCCASWGITTTGTQHDQNTDDPGWLCMRCANSPPTACNRRHLQQTMGSDAR